MRSPVTGGETITLRALFLDGDGNPKDPDSTPDVYIYDETFSQSDIDAEVDASTITGSGPFTPSKIVDGFYEYEYTVPSGSDEGTYFDLWVGEIDGVQTYDILSFDVVAGGVVKGQDLEVNQYVVIELDASIADTSGNKLGEDTALTFSTEYDPFYASPDLVRTEVGPWIDFIPDETLALLIHWASKEADFRTPKGFSRLETVPHNNGVDWRKRGLGKNQSGFEFARTMFVVYKTAYRSLLLPGAANAVNVTGNGLKKSLADLSVSGPSGSGFGKGLDWKQIEELKDLAREWGRVMNAGGNILPGQDLAPAVAMRGIADPSRRKTGRLWMRGNSGYPTVNDKHRFRGHKHARWFYNSDGNK